MDKLTNGKTVEKEQKKPSRLRMLLHLWGGICLNAFAETSGVAKAVLVSLKGYDPTSASKYALSAGLLTVGIATAGYFMSSFLVKQIDSIALPKKSKTIIKGLLPVAYLTGAILLATVVGPVLTKSGHDSHPSSVKTAGHEITPVITMSTIQDSEGFTEADFNLEGLKNIEEWSVTTVLQKARTAYAETGNDPTQFKSVPVSDSQLVNVGGKKLAIIKITLYPSQTDRQTATKMVRIFGFTKQGMETVGCIRNSNHDIPIWSGECGKIIKEVFGVEIKP